MFDEHQDLHSGQIEKLYFKSNNFSSNPSNRGLMLHWSISAMFRLLRFHVPFRLRVFLLTGAWFLFLTTSRWFAVRLDGICSIFVTITTFGCLYLRDGTAFG